MMMHLRYLVRHHSLCALCVPPLAHSYGATDTYIPQHSLPMLYSCTRRALPLPPVASSTLAPTRATGHRCHTPPPRARGGDLGRKALRRGHTWCRLRRTDRRGHRRRACADIAQKTRPNLSPSPNLSLTLTFTLVLSFALRLTLTPTPTLSPTLTLTLTLIPTPFQACSYREASHYPRHVPQITPTPRPVAQCRRPTTNP